MLIEFKDGTTFEIPQEGLETHPYVIANTLEDTDYSLNVVSFWNKPVGAILFMGIVLLLAPAELFMQDEAILSELNMIIFGYNVETNSWEAMEFSGVELMENDSMLQFLMATAMPVYSSHDIYLIGTDETQSPVKTDMIALPKSKDTFLAAPYDFFKSLGDFARETLNVTTKFNSTTLLQTLSQIPNEETIMNDFAQSSKAVEDPYVISILSGTLEELTDPELIEITDGYYSRFGVTDSKDNSVLKKVDLPNLLTLGGYGFSGQKGLREVYLPKCQKLGSDVFEACGVSTLYIPEVTELGARTFQEVSMSKLTFYKPVSLGYIPFYQSYINTIDFHQPMVEVNPDATFTQAKGLRTLIFRDTSGVQPISIVPYDGGSTGQFSQTPIGSGNGYIYVPLALLDAYKADANWSVVASQIRAIEDYPDICGV